MALIQCYECGNQISDSAASCPKCGAPNTASAQTIASDPGTSLLCPFCKNPLHESAITCGSCGAEYGYYDGRRIYNSKWTVIIFGLIMPLVLTVLAFNFNEFLGAVVGFILLFVFLKALWQLIKGPQWWKQRL